MKYHFCILILILSIQLHAQPGFPDQTFGTSGIVLGTFPTDYNSGMGIFQQSDGKLLNAGTISQVFSLDDIYLLRYLSDGSLDSSFGINGSVSGPIGNGDDQAFDVIQLSDSKILVVGAYDNTVERDVFIRRYDSTGVLDTSFAIGGMVTTDFQNGSDDTPLRVRIQPDGKILVCGSTTETVNYTTSIMLMRYNPDGTLDSTFGIGGKVSSWQMAGDQAVSQFALQPDGKIIAVGVNDDVNGEFDMLALRFLPNGLPDSSFNGDGIFTFDLSGDNDECWAVALQADGKILLGGLGVTFNGEDDMLIRLDSTGYPDPSFNSTGILTKDHNLSSDYITSILVQPDGKIITVGQSYDMDEKISLSRYLASGADDINFGIGGTALYSMGNGDSYSTAAILQSDNRIVITGSIETPVTSNNYTARFTNDSLSVNLSEISVHDKGLYPIPASDKIFVKDVKHGSYMTIFDAQGQIVFQGRSENSSIDVSALSPGIYLLKIESGTEQSVRKFIKQ